MEMAIIIATILESDMSLADIKEVYLQSRPTRTLCETFQEQSCLRGYIQVLLESLEIAL